MPSEAEVCAMFRDLWLFLLGVWGHAITLAAGCVVTVMLGILEKRVLKRPISLKTEIGILLAFVFFACFQAWQDEHIKAMRVQTAPSVQITMPAITVPPAQVVVTPAPPSRQSHDLTGFLELAKLDLATKTISQNSPIEANVGFIVKGTQPIDRMTYITTGALGDNQHGWQESEEKAGEKELWRTFSTQLIDKARKEIIQKKFQGHRLGVGNGIVYRTATSPPLTEPQVAGILSGTTRFYVLSWATWKDSNNRVGDLTTCNWMQAPTSLDVSNQQTVWHLCTWVP
jgi:hypothetical protein